MSDAALLASAGQAVVANDHLDSPQDLQRLWDANGYLYFRDVVDRAVIDDIRREYLRVLHGLGLIDDPAGTAVWNGASLDALDHAKLPQIAETDSWRRFTSSPSVNAVLRKVLRDEPVWLPMTEYRAVPPSEGEARFLGIHQDGYQNAGMSFHGVWVPLGDIDETMGGMVLAEGWHKRGFMHDDRSQRVPLVAPAAIEPRDWRRSHYRPGDMIVFSDMIPHAGVSNRSDRFRLSMDLRVAGASAPLPVVGAIVAAAQGRITIRTAHAGDVSLAIDERTRLRLAHGVPVAPADIAARMTVGMAVIASHEAGVAITIRSAAGG